MDRFTEEFSKSRIASHVESARAAGALFDEDGTPGWPCEPLDQDETDFAVAFERAHGHAATDSAMDDFWTAFNDAAIEAVRENS